MTALSTTTARDNSYRTIETSTITDQINTILEGANIQYTVKTRYRPDGLSTSKHVIVYSLLGFDDYRLVGDRVTPQIYVFNSYNKESAFMLSVGFLRAVCDNGMVAGTDLFTTRIIHRKGQTAESKLAAIGVGLRNALAYISDGLQADVAKLGATDLTEEQGETILCQLKVPKRAREDAIMVWKGEKHRRWADQANTVWSLWNIINECMRKRARSEVRNLEYNRDLLTGLTNLVAIELKDEAA